MLLLAWASSPRVKECRVWSAGVVVRPTLFALSRACRGRHAKTFLSYRTTETRSFTQGGGLATSMCVSRTSGPYSTEAVLNLVTLPLFSGFELRGHSHLNMSFNTALNSGVSSASSPINTEYTSSCGRIIKHVNTILIQDT